MRSTAASVRSAVLLVLCIGLLSGCLGRQADTGIAPARGTKSYTVAGKTYHPLKSAEGYREKGLASWYGPGFHGKRTASGERFDQNGLTAAHAILPLGTRVRVTNTANGKSVVVRVNDRGPFADGRIIDLSKRAARDLGLLDKGVGEVIVESLGKTVAAGNAAVRDDGQPAVIADALQAAGRLRETGAGPAAKGRQVSDDDARPAPQFFVRTRPFSKAMEAHKAYSALAGAAEAAIRKTEAGYTVLAGPFADEAAAEDTAKACAAYGAEVVSMRR